MRQKQAYGPEATRATTELVLNRTVNLRPIDYDKYGRTVAFIGLPDGRDLGRELVRAGAAWHYVRYSQDADLGNLEAQARSARVGLWADPLPEPPSVYRAARREHSAQRKQGRAKKKYRTAAGAALIPAPTARHRLLMIPTDDGCRTQASSTALDAALLMQ